MKATGNSMRASRRLRRQLTPPEALLWKLLQGSPCGLRFRRQYAIGPYVADFYCPSAKLVIEIDGQVHNFEHQAKHDGLRDEIIRESGVQIYRIAAAEAMREATSVANAIVETCLAARPFHHSASPSGPPPHRSATGRSE
jgi:very-short-patch-repair endonuclease